ncbi:MAG: histidine kinase N-terminal 7TM domain-containing protein [Candidatus Heimdallarchaeota archaeon]
MYEFTLAVIPYILSAIVVSLLTLYVFAFYPGTRTNYMFVLMTGAASWWGIGYIFEILAVDYSTMVFWLYVQYFSIMYLPVFFFLFSLSFTHYAEYFFVNSKRLVPLFFPGTFIYILVLTNSSHELIFDHIELFDAAAFPSLTYSPGPFLWAHIIISASFVLVAVFMVARSYFLNPHPLYKKQVITFLASVSAILTGLMIDIIELFPFSIYLNITPLTFMVFASIFLIGMYNFDLLGILPAAHNLIFRTTNLGIIITTLDHRIIDVNPQGWTYIADPFFTGSRETSIGMNFFSFLSKQRTLTPYLDQIQDIEKRLVALSRDPEKKISLEIEGTLPDQSRRSSFRILIEALHEGDNHIGFIYLIQDITSEREVTNLLKTSNEFRQSLLNIISHDLKNSIHVIRGFTDLLSSNLADANTSFESERYLESIAFRAREMEEIIDHTLEYVITLDTHDYSELELKPMNLQKEFGVIKRTYNVELQKKELQLEEKWPSDQGEFLVLADYRINSVLRNLLDNAIKFSPNGGTIEVEIRKQENPREWLFRISDSGPGIPQNGQDEIFKPFAAIGPPEKRGSGFGLSISYNIVRAYQGKLWYEENLPKGTTFYLSLPIYDTQE